MSAAVFWCTVIVVLVAAIVDSRSRRIPNWLVVPFLAAGFVIQLADQGLNGLWAALAGLAVASLATCPLYLLGGLGMGDCKLLAAVGVWVGPEQTLFVLVATALAGGVVALAYAGWRGALLRSVFGTAEVLATVVGSGFRPHPTAHLDNPSTLKVPFALAIAIGTIVSFYTQ
jgi:prepilin peptidase CpaA